MVRSLILLMFIGTIDGRTISTIKVYPYERPANIKTDPSVPHWGNYSEKVGEE